MANTLLNKNYVAEAAIAAYRIVKFGAADGQVLQAAAAADAMIGVCESVGPAIGERCDIVKAGIAEVEFAGVVARGGPVTADAIGRGVAAAPGAGANVRIIGFAEVTTAAGDIAPVLLAPGLMQG